MERRAIHNEVCQKLDRIRIARTATASATADGRFGAGPPVHPPIRSLWPCPHCTTTTTTPPRPLCRCTSAACVALYLATAVTGFPDTSSVCLAAAPVLHGQAFRIVTAALSHAGLLHLGMNMLAFLPLGEGQRTRVAAQHCTKARLGRTAPLLPLPYSVHSWMTALIYMHTLPAVLALWL